jgi:hypothetical protein
MGDDERADEIRERPGGGMVPIGFREDEAGILAQPVAIKEIQLNHYNCFETHVRCSHHGYGRHAGPASPLSASRLRISSPVTRRTSGAETGG